MVLLYLLSIGARLALRQEARHRGRLMTDRAPERSLPPRQRTRASVVIRSSSAREVQQLLTALARTMQCAATRRSPACACSAAARLAASKSWHRRAPTTNGARVAGARGHRRPARRRSRRCGPGRSPFRPVRLAAVLVLRPWVAHEDGTRVMEALVTCALDDQQSAELRDRCPRRTQPAPAPPD